MEDAELHKDIKIEESERSLLIAERVGEVRCFGVVLASGVLVKVLEPVLHCQLIGVPCVTK